MCSILLFRSIQPEDKSFAVGIQFMLLRVLGKLRCIEIPSWKAMAAPGEGFPKAGKDAALQALGVHMERMRQGSSISVCKPRRAGSNFRNSGCVQTLLCSPPDIRGAPHPVL